MIYFIEYDRMTNKVYPLGREMAQVSRKAVPNTPDAAEIFRSLTPGVRAEDDVLVEKKDNIIAQIELLLSDGSYTMGDVGEILERVYDHLAYKAEVRA